MNQYAYDLNPVQRIVADAIGEPGNRTFFIQGRAGSSLVTVVLEKQEVANLAVSVLQLLEELEQKYPNLKPVASSNSLLVPESPVEPLFRVAQLIVGYDEEDDMIWLIARARTAAGAGSAGELGAQVVDDEELEELDELPEIDYFGLDESADADDDEEDDDVDEMDDDDVDDAEAPAVRFVATRAQMRALSEHALEIVARGRPTCPLCGHPIERAGHFCPRSDGQAMPIIF